MDFNINLLQDTLIAPNDPFKVAFSIGSLDIYWYAILSILGYATAILIYHLTLKFRYKIAVEPGFYYVFIAIPSIFLGARIWSCIIGDAQWQSFFNFRNGGLAVQGGVVFGIIAALIYFPLILSRPKFHKKVVEGDTTYILRPSMWLYADSIIPTILIGQAIGRWGNFFNGEIFGQLVTTNPDQYNSLTWLKALFPTVYDHMICVVPNLSVGTQLSNGLINGAIYQPLFLYESFINVVDFILIYLILPVFKQIKAGVISGCYFVGYGITRFITESLRNSKFEFAGTYVINSILLVSGIVIIVYCQFINNWLRNYKCFQIFKNWIKNKKLKIQLHFKEKKVKKIQNEIKQINNKNQLKTKNDQLKIYLNELDNFKKLNNVVNFNKDYIIKNYLRLKEEMYFYDWR